MDPRRLALLCCEYADDKKAEDLLALEVKGLSSVTDFFVLATGNNEPHLRAIFDGIERGLREDHGIKPLSMDGRTGASWIVMDYFDVIVHIMKTEVRELYDLESLWRDARRIKFESELATSR